MSVARRRSTTSATARGYGADWQRVRLVVLWRDRFRCRDRGGPAKTVDHVVSLLMGGARLDPANLVACCGGCNSRKGGTPASVARFLGGAPWSADVAQRSDRLGSAKGKGRPTPPRRIHRGAIRTDGDR